MSNCRCPPPARGYKPAVLRDVTMVTIKVGTEPTTDFHIPGKYLKAVSPYFENELKPHSSGEVRRTLRLKYVREVVFRQFIEWLESRMIYSHGGRPIRQLFAEERLENGKPIKPEKEDGAIQMCHLHVFAVKYDIPQFRRDTIDVLMRLSLPGTQTPPFDHLVWWWSTVPTLGMGCRLIFDIYVSKTSPEQIIADVEAQPSDSIPEDLLRKLLKAMHDKLTWKVRSPHEQPCTYHEN